MNILIIDDDPFFTRTMAAQLRNASKAGNIDLEIHESHRPDEAIEYLWSDLQNIGLVLCDLQMPEMDGVEFVRLLSRMGYTGGLALVSGEDLRILRTAEQLAEALQLWILGSYKKPISADAIETLLERAESRGRQQASPDVVVYSPEEIRQAIEEGQLVNFYQPKVDIQTGEAVGVEALVRWAHPRNGLVMPMAFIPIAEATGLVSDIGGCVTRSAVRDLRQWESEGLSLKVSINVALNSLVAVDFPDELSMLVSEAGVSPEQLILEITESRLMENPQAELDVLTRLRLKRFGLSIDDFGTGYSGLDRLRSLPFNELKIDRSFVGGVTNDPTSRAIVRASLMVARQLNMTSVAEGVEEFQDWISLRDAGCDLAQGYFIGRPMPGREIQGWLIEWQKRKRELLGPALW